jgi:uncharacterized protein YgiM (DUF1202 family)/flavin-binding protein dodecin
MEYEMNTRCKKWKYMLYITTVATAFASTPVSTQAANVKVAITGSTNTKLDITSSKTDSAANTMRTLTTAGVADILDADISMEKEELVALVKSKTVQSTDKKKESTLVMANVNEYVSIRKEPDLDSEKLGILYKDCSGQLIEKGDEWSEITSGGITGWVRNKYLYFGDEAQKIAEEVGILTARSNTETLRVRKEASLDSGILGLLAKGEAVEAIEEDGDWVSVSYEGTTGYVAAEYVTVEFTVDEAESMEVIREREAEEKAREAAVVNTVATSSESSIQPTVMVQKEAVMATASELEILAALIQCEAGGEPYEGQVAVGAVVMNRVRCAAYPDTITDVIYASGQFVPASGSRMQNLILNGTTKESCIQAAQEAINGASPVGDALYFRRVGSKSGTIIGNHVFW